MISKTQTKRLVNDEEQGRSGWEPPADFDIVKLCVRKPQAEQIQQQARRQRNDCAEREHRSPLGSPVILGSHEATNMVRSLLQKASKQPNAPPKMPAPRLAKKLANQPLPARS